MLPKLLGLTRKIRISRTAIFLAVFLAIALVIKTYFLSHVTPLFFGLTFEDIMLRLSYANSSPVPIPYISGFVEYPVIIGIFIWVTAILSSGTGFFILNGILLSIASVFSVGLLERLGGLGRRELAIIFLSPTPFLFTAYNWDALAVLFTSLGIFYFSKKKFLLTSLFFALGANTKLYPGLFLPPLFVIIYKELGVKELLKNLFGVGLISFLINIPFIIFGYEGWSVFLKFNSSRGPNIDSIWAGIWKMALKFIDQGALLKFTNAFSLALFLIPTILILFFLFKNYLSKNYLPLFLISSSLILFLFIFTNKVYSPPYNLWFLPFFILIPKLNLKKILAYEWANGLVYWSVFQYFFETNILGKNVLDFPWYKLTYFFVLFRHLTILFLILELFVIFKSALNHENIKDPPTKI